MKALEEELQVAIFDRSRRTPELTPVGRAVVAKARKVIEAYDNIVPSSMNESWAGGVLTLGAVPTTLTGLVPFSLTLLRDNFADLHVRVVPGLTTDLVSQLERGALDAAVVSKPHFLSAALEWREIAHEPFELLAPRQAESDRPLELLQNHPFIRFSRKAIVGGLIDNWLQQHRVKVREGMELESLESIASMVFSNLGVSIVPKSCVSAPNPLPVKRLPLDPDPGGRVLGLLFRRDTNKVRPIDVLCARLRQAAEIGEYRTERTLPA